MKIQSYLYVDNESLQRYLELLIRTLQAGLSDNGWTVPAQPTSTINTLVSKNYVPVLPNGTIWFDTDVKKLKVLVTAAVAGISNGIVETVTSV
jgi:hypothetical protein